METITDTILNATNNINQTFLKFETQKFLCETFNHQFFVFLVILKNKQSSKP